MKVSSMADFFKDIIEQTENGKISWAKSAANVFVYSHNNSQGELFRSVIQRVKRPSMQLKHTPDSTPEFFVYQTEGKGEIILSVSTDEREDLYQVLFRVFTSARSSVDKQTLATLQGILS